MARILGNTIPSIVDPVFKPIFADVVLDYFDSGAGPIPGPYGTVSNSSNIPFVPVDLDIIVDNNTTEGSLALPTNSFVTVGFLNASVRDKPGNDIAVEELTNVGERAEVYVSSDGSDFVLLGIAAAGRTSAFDLASIGFTDSVEAVRIVGLDTGGGTPGFDVLNVRALQPVLDLSSNFIALKPEWNSENRSLRYGFEVEGANAPIGLIAENIKVSLYFANNGNTISEISGTNLLNPEIVGNRVFYDFPIENIPLQLSNEELNANQISTFVDSENVVLENGGDNRQEVDYFFVRKIPQIMRNIGEEWEVAASFQERWLNNEGVVLEPPVSNAISNANSPTQLVTIDWILQDSVDTNNRAQEAFNRLTDTDVLFNDNAKDELADILDDRLENEPVGTVIELEVEGRSAAALQGQSIQLSEVDSGFIPIIDPLTGALGDFSFYAIPLGEAEKSTDDEIIVRATGVGIFALDIFEFGGFQPLGSWRTPDEVFRLSRPGATSVSNATYRDYREQTGLGEDFVIASLVEEVSLPGGVFEVTL